jgi:aminoglycoside phosphotransferase (APT) family kinase protein
LDSGTGPAAQPAWPDLIRQTLTAGGDGHCRPETLAASPDTRGLLDVLRRVGESCCAAVPAAADFVHYDFSPWNLLGDGPAITAVIDVNPPVLAGDRAFDLATLLFYLYDHEEIRRRLWARLLDLASRRTARAYLAHMVLRQVDWSLRFYPEAPQTRYYLGLARQVTADIGDAG